MIYNYMFFYSSYSIEFFSENQKLPSPKSTKSSSNNNEQEDMQDETYAYLSLLFCLLIKIVCI